MIPASSNSEKIQFANSLSCEVYCGNLPLHGFVSEVRLIECSIRSVGWISHTVAAKQSFQVYSSCLALDLCFTVSTFDPMEMPDSLNQLSIIFSLSPLSCLT